MFLEFTVGEQLDNLDDGVTILLTKDQSFAPSELCCGNVRRFQSFCD